MQVTIIPRISICILGKPKFDYPLYLL